LQTKGYRDVAVLKGGFAGWIAAGYPVDEVQP
jgi:3-mercaptopyruvate sulfurtransferase SseA